MKLANIEAVRPPLHPPGGENLGPPSPYLFSLDFEGGMPYNEALFIGLPNLGGRFVNQEGLRAA